MFLYDTIPVMIQERVGFKPSLLGRVLDATITAARGTPPADILWGLFRANGPYMKVLEGKVSDSEKVRKATEDYTLWYERLYSWAHRNDKPNQP
jgi:hypothetical protein